MSNTTKTIRTTLGILALVGAVVAGTAWRSHVEGQQDFFGLVANNSKDSTISEVEFFRELSTLIKQQYVDKVTDDQKLASGAVRGMIQSLGDPNSFFMDATQFAVYRRSIAGNYEGIGAEFALLTDDAVKTSTADPDEAENLGSAAKLPKLTIINVLPGSPAEKAGLKPGDVVDTVNGHWIINAKSIYDFRQVRAKLQANKITRDEYAKAHRVIRLKLESSILPSRARERMFSGTSGEVKLTVNRKGQLLEFVTQKAPTVVKPFQAEGSTISRLAFTPGAAESLRSAIAGKKEVSIDLRRNALGDFEAMRKCLSVLLPAGTYGEIATEKDDKPTKFAIGAGVANAPKIKLLVDSGTSGPASVFTTILKHYAGATVVGDLRYNPLVTSVVALPDGSGYTLTIGSYRDKKPSKTAVARPEPKVIEREEVMA